MLSCGVSVTFVYCDETSKHIKIFDTILVLPYQNLWQYYASDSLTGVSNAGGVWKSRFSAVISEMIQDRAIVTVVRQELVYVIYRMAPFPTRRERMYPRQRCFDGSLAQWIKNHCKITRATDFSDLKTSDFSDVKFGVPALTIAQKAIRFRHPDCNPDWAHQFIHV